LVVAHNDGEWVALNSRILLQRDNMQYKFIEYSFFLHDRFKNERYSISTARENAVIPLFIFIPLFFHFAHFLNADAKRRSPVCQAGNRRFAFCIKATGLDW
jgi:hypothetical protein